MSKLSDYSKFDHIDEDESSTEGDGAAGLSEGGGKGPVSGRPSSSADPVPSAAASAPARTAMTKKNDEGRYVFECDGRKIYEWEQSLEEVNMYIDAPPGIKADQIMCKIQIDRLQIGLKGSDRLFIDENTFSKVKIDDSSWYLDDAGVINVILAKVFRGETWESALLGKNQMEVVDPVTKEQIQKDLVLERFQEENPGFDFRGAAFNGSVPDPRTFMGGIGSG